MRRDMDELFGDVLERTGLARRGMGLCPAVDVAYTTEPPRVIVTAELPGVDAAALELEVQGRTLILSGVREPAVEEGCVYGQLEIERGHFRRTVELAADVHADQASASLEDGMLRVELPLAVPASRTRAVSIEASGATR